MGELSDIVTLTTISSDRANLWQARLVQRYSSVANRTTEHPSPDEGDLSYLEDSNTVWMYDGTAWVTLVGDSAVTTAKLADGSVTVAKIDGTGLAASFEIDGIDEQGNVVATVSYTTKATVVLAIPAPWGTWKCTAWATGRALAGVDAQIQIDGTPQQAIEGASGVFSIVSRRAGITTSGSRNIVLQMRHSGGGDATVNDIALYARAVRTG